jgi:hypothetical protein
LGFSDVHGRVPNGTLGSERVNRRLQMTRHC